MPVYAMAAGPWHIQACWAWLATEQRMHVQLCAVAPGDLLAAQIPLHDIRDYRDWRMLLSLWF